MESVCYLVLGLSMLASAWLDHRRRRAGRYRWGESHFERMAAVHAGFCKRLAAREAEFNRRLTDREMLSRGKLMKKRKTIQLDDLVPGACYEITAEVNGRMSDLSVTFVEFYGGGRGKLWLVFDTAGGVRHHIPSRAIQSIRRLEA